MQDVTLEIDVFQNSEALYDNPKVLGSLERLLKKRFGQYLVRY